MLLSDINLNKNKNNSCEHSANLQSMSCYLHKKNYNNNNKYIIMK